MELDELIRREIWTMNEDEQPFNVQELKNIHSFAGRKRYVESHLPRIGQGSGRAVYDMGDKVLKLAKNVKGVAQNEFEAGMGKNDYYARNYVTEVFEYDEEDNQWIIAEKGKKLKPTRFKEITGVDIKDLDIFLHNFEQQNKGMRATFHQDEELVAELWENEFASGILDLMQNYDLGAGDLGKLNSYGEVFRDGQPDVVLTDYGLSRDVWKQHYERRLGEAENNFNKELKDDPDTSSMTDGGYAGWALLPNSISQGGLNNGISHRDTTFDRSMGSDVSEAVSPEKNPAILKRNGKRFWIGSASLLDGHIEEVHSYETAEASDFHHSMYFSPQQLEKLSNDENTLFWVDQDGIQGWKEIPQQIEIAIENQYDEGGTLTEENLNEGMKPIDNIGLIIKDNAYYIYDTKIEKVIDNFDVDEAEPYILGGMILKPNSDFGGYEIDSITARDGYGPLLYLIALSAAGNSGAMPTRNTGDISDEGKNVWKEFDGGKGAPYIKDTVNLPDKAHVEPYLNKKYIVSQPVDTYQMYQNHQNLVSNDPYGEKETFLYELADGLLTHAMRGLHEDFKEDKNLFGTLREWDDYSNIDPVNIDKAVDYIESLGEIGKPLLNDISNLYKNYMVSSQNIEQSLQKTDDDVGFFHKLMKIQDLLKNFGLIKEDLVYSHVDGSADPESDNYKIGPETLSEMDLPIGKIFSAGTNEDATSLYRTEHGNVDASDNKSLEEDRTIINADDVEDIEEIFDDYVGILSPHQLENNERNNKASKILKDLLNKFGFKYVIGIGEWDNDTDTHEQSYIIKKPENLEPKEFHGVIAMLSKKFDQDAYIFGSEGDFTLYFKNGDKKHIGNSIAFDDEEYKSFDFVSESVITEAGAGINRIMKHMKEEPFAIMSANRNELDREQNRMANDKLSQELQSKQAGFVNLIGHWEEIQGGNQANSVQVREQSFFIPMPKGMDIYAFKDWILGLGEDFGQDAVLIGEPINTPTKQQIEALPKQEYFGQPRNIPRPIGDINAKLFYMDGRVENKGKPNLENIGTSYSQLRKKPDATFVFEENTENLNERKKSYMPGAIVPKIKKSCTLGGNPDGTSEPCSQGDAGAVSYEKLDEAADEITLPDGKKLDYTDIGAYPFGWKPKGTQSSVDFVKVGIESKTHGQSDLFNWNQKDGTAGYDVGRIWVEDKIISFWDYPNKIVFEQIINDLEKQFGIMIRNNGWKVEVWKTKNPYNQYGNEYNSFVPVENYNGSIAPPEELKAMHLMNQKEKEELKKKGWGKGTGSDKYATKKPLAYRQAIYQESDDPRIKSLKKRYDVGTIEDKEGNEYIIYQLRPETFVIWKDGKGIGHLHLSKNDDGSYTPDAGGANAAWIDPEYRMKGLAKAMYKYAMGKGFDIVPSNVQSAGAKGIWNSLNEVGEGSSQPYDLQAITHPNGLSFEFTTDDGQEYRIRASMETIDKYKIINGVNHEDSDLRYVSQKLPDKINVIAITYTLKELDKPINRFQAKVKKPELFPTTNKGELFRIMATVKKATNAAYKHALQKMGVVHGLTYIAKEDKSGDDRRKNMNRPFVEKGMKEMGLPVKRKIEDGSKVTYIINDGQEIEEGVGDKFLQNRGVMPDEEQEFLRQQRMKDEEEFVFEESPDGWNMVKNPKRPSNLDFDVRGLIDRYGNMYLETKSKYIHTDLVEILENKGVIREQPYWWSTEPKELLTIQRVLDTNEIRVGESNTLYGPNVDVEAKYNNLIKQGYELPSLEDIQMAFEVFLKRAELKNPAWKFPRKKMHESVDMEEGVGDKFLQNRGVMPDAEQEFDKNYNVENQEEVIADLTELGQPNFLIKNPKSINSVGCDARGVIDSEGNIYVETTNESPNTHDDLLTPMAEQGIIKYDPKWWKTFVDYITIHRKDCSNNFLLGESNVLVGSRSKYFNIQTQGLEIPPDDEIKQHYIPFLQRAKQKNPKFNFPYQKIYDGVSESVKKIVTNVIEESYINSMNESTTMTLQDLPFKEDVERMGGEIYSVGGAVRDEFLGKESKDLDILVRGIPEEELLKLLENYGQASMVGESFGVIKFKPHGSDPSEEPIDIALPRREVSTGAGHKNFEVMVDHTLPVEEDLKRRDFTINAIAKDADGNLIDPFNGQQDLKDKVIRMTSPNSFIDDELRMLRAVQFASRFGFDIDPETFQAMQASADTIKEVKGERILEELNKIVNKGNMRFGAQLLRDSGLFKAMFGYDLEQSTIDEAPFENARTMGEFIYLILKDMGDPAKVYKQNLKGEIPTTKEIQALKSGIEKVSDDPAKNRALVNAMYGIFPLSIKSGILPEKLQLAVKELSSSKYPLSYKDMDLNGNDLMELGLKGQQIGTALRNALLAIYADEVRNKKEDLLNFTKQFLNPINESEDKMKKVSYSAVVLDEESRSKLLGMLAGNIPSGWEKIAHHMTINMGPLSPDMKGELGKEVNLKVTHEGHDDKVMAVGVQGYPSKNKSPHITIAVNRKNGGKPYMSNNIKKWKTIAFGLDLKGTVQEVR